MSATDPAPGRNLAIALSMLPVLLIVSLAANYAVNVPYHDEWDWSVARVLAGDLIHFRIGEFWRLGNEHRVFVPQMLMTAIAHVTNLNMLVPVYVKIAFTVVILGVLSSLYVRTATARSRAFVTVLMALVTFSLAQWPRWIDVRPMPSTLSILGLAGAIWFVSTGRPSPARFAGAAAMAVLSSLSYFAGNITWFVVGAAMAVGGWRWRYLSAWILFAAAVLVPYALDFWGSDSIARVSQPAPVSQIVEFTFLFLGSLMSGQPVHGAAQGQALAFGVAGSIGVIAVTVLLRRDLPGGWRQALPWLTIACWVLINAVAAGYGRAELGGVTGARVPRYTVFGAQFWIALSALGGLALLEPGTSRRLRITGAVTLLVVLLGLANGTIFKSGSLADYPNQLSKGRQSLLLGNADVELLYPRPERVREMLPALIERRASFLQGLETQKHR